MPFRLCNVLGTFQRLMQNCLSKLNLIYCLIYLDDTIIFSQTAEEHLHRLCMWSLTSSGSTTLNLKPSKCSLFKEEINYLGHQVSKEGVQPSNSNLRAITKCAPPQTYMEILAFLQPCGPLSVQFIKGFVHILHSCWMDSSQEKAPVGNQKGCHYQKMPWEPSILWNRCAWVHPSPKLSLIILKNSY